MKERNRKIEKRNIIIAITAIVFCVAAFFIVVYNRSEKPTISKVPSKNIVKKNNENLNYVIKSNKLYRVQLGSFTKQKDAQVLVNKMISKKLGGFIINENGYIVVFGVFDSAEAANTIKNQLKISKIDSTIFQINESEKVINYTSSDTELIKTIEAVEKSCWLLFKYKADLSSGIFIKGLMQYQGYIENIILLETQMEKDKYYLENINNEKQLDVIKDEYIELLDSLLANRLNIKNKNDYFDIQSSLLKQTMAYEEFVKK